MVAGSVGETMVPAGPVNWDQAPVAGATGVFPVSTVVGCVMQSSTSAPAVAGWALPSFTVTTT